MAGRPVVFVGGAGRSGTTLVADLLGTHPNISPVYETDFVLEVARELLGGADGAAARVRRYMEEWTRPLPHRPHHKRPHERYRHGPRRVRFDRAFALARTDDLLARAAAGDPAGAVRGFVLALFAEHCRADGKPRWGNETPASVLHLPLLGRLFPGMRFVHCVRDGRDVAASVLTRPWGPRTRAETGDWWAGRVRAGRAFGRDHPGRYFEVRYEALLADPAPVADALLRWLGEPGRGADPVAAYGAAADALLNELGYPPE